MMMAGWGGVFGRHHRARVRDDGGHGGVDLGCYRAQFAREDVFVAVGRDFDVAEPPDVAGVAVVVEAAGIDQGPAGLSSAR